MITSELRTLELGTTGEVWGFIEDRELQDLSGLTVEVATVSPAGVVSAWAAPSDVDTDTPGVMRVLLVHTATVEGLWKLKARLINGPLVEVLTLGGFFVVP